MLFLVLGSAYLLVVAQVLLAQTGLGPWTPDLLVIGLLAGHPALRGVSRILWTAGLGLAADALGPSGLGIHLLCYGIVGLLLDQLRSPQPLSALGWGFTTGSCALVLRGLTAGMYYLLHDVASSWEQLLSAGLTGACATGLLAAVLKVVFSVRLGEWEGASGHAPVVNNHWRMLSGDDVA